MREDLGAKSFQQALIPKGLKIICKVLRGNLHPLVQGGGSAAGYLTERSDEGLRVHFFYLPLCGNGG
jgi:hypothetical protein